MKNYSFFISLLMVMFLSVGNVWGANYAKTAEGSVKTGDVVIITYDNGTLYAMSNDVSSSNPPSAVSVTATNDVISTDATKILWDVTVADGSFTFRPHGDVTNALYCTATNNGVRVGTNANNAFTVDGTSKYLVNTATKRYVGCYNSQDFRCYTSINANIKEQTPAFYVLQEGGDEPGGGEEPGGGDDPAPAAVNYEKVAAEPSDWSGEYLLVYEANATKARVWKGADQANNYAEATITAGVIAAPEGAAELTIAKVANSTPVVYTIKVGDKYIGQTSNANGIKIQDAAINNSISYNGTDAAVDIIASEAHLRYNKASSSYFRYYKSSTYSSQEKIQLYKKVDGAVKPEAGLAYAVANQKKLTKLGDAFTAPTLSNPNNLSGITYASDNTTVAEVAANGAVTIKAAGVAIITASFEGNDDYKAGSASYTIGVTSHTGTEADPYVAADAKIAIDVKGTVENACATGIVCNIVTTALPAEGYITFFFSADGATSGQQIEAYKCYGLNSDPFEALTDVKTGATVVVTGTLKKYNSTYEFDQNCHLVSYEAPAVQKTHIANTKETAYTVAQAITYAADGVTYDLDDYVYVQGVVYDVKNFSNGAMDIFIKDANAENQFELYKCAGINDGSSTTPFDALTDVQVGDVVIGYGQLTVYNGVYEFKQGNYLVDLDREEVVLTDYYEKVIETTGITDGTYLIVYEAGSLAFNGSLETLDAESNTINVAITKDHKIGVTPATEAATFFIDATAGSIQSARGKYIGVTSNSNGLKTSDEANAYSHNFSIDNDRNAIIAAAFEGSTMSLRYNTASNQARFRYYKDNSQQPIQLYKLANEVVKANPELAWSAESVEITLGETFTAPTLNNPHSVEGITYSSDNEALATVTSAGVISLVADATGTAHITATFAGNDDYKVANVSCTIIVNSSTPAPAPSGNVVILAEYGSKFYAMTTSIDNKTAGAVEVEKDGDKIVVPSAEAKAAIQWTKITSGENTTFQDADDNYLKGVSNGGDLTLVTTACNWSWNATDGYYYIGSRSFIYRKSANGFKNYAVSNAGSSDYSTIAEVRVIDPANIVVTEKADAELAYTPADVTLTVGGDFTPAVLGYAEGFDGLASVTYASSNEALATVNESGVVSLVADAIGTATITATFAGNNNYQAGSASYTITVSEADDDLSGTWALVTDAAQLAAGKKVVIAYCGLEGNYLVAKTMGAQNTNNRAAVASSTKTTTDYTSLTLGSGTKVFTLVDAGDGKFAIKASNSKYLTSATSGTSNNLLEADDYSLGNAKWTIAISNEVANIVAAAGSKKVMQYNSTNTLFSCYGSANQKPVRIYMLQEDTPVVPQPDYTRSITAGQFGTICLPNSGRIEGATIFEIAHTKDGKIFFDEISEATMVAGRPYIFYPNNGASELKVYYTGSENAAAGTYNGLYGSYEQTALAQNDGNYILYDNKYYLVDSEAYVGANRAYIKLGEVPTEEQAPAPGRRRVSMDVQGEQVATSIINTHYGDQPMKVMIDNQLYIIRAGQMFDMTGNKIK